jgi:hypothetical protein
MKIVFAVLPHLIIAVSLLGVVLQIFRFGEPQRALRMAKGGPRPRSDEVVLAPWLARKTGYERNIAEPLASGNVLPL